MSRPIVDPDGRRWAVRRRWLPRLGGETSGGRFSRRMRGVRERAEVLDAASLLDAFDDGILGAIALAVFVVVAVAFVVLVVAPLLLALGELLVVVPVALGVLVTRVVLRRPWVLEAHCQDGPTHRWRVTGWRASGRRCQEIEEAIRAGEVPPPDDAGRSAG